MHKLCCVVVWYFEIYSGNVYYVLRKVIPCIIQINFGYYWHECEIQFIYLQLLYFTRFYALVFIPLCDEKFQWRELTEGKIRRCCTCNFLLGRPRKNVKTWAFLTFPTPVSKCRIYSFDRPCVRSSVTSAFCGFTRSWVNYVSVLKLLVSLQVSHSLLQVLTKLVS